MVLKKAASAVIGQKLDTQIAMPYTDEMKSTAMPVIKGLEEKFK